MKKTVIIFVVVLLMIGAALPILAQQRKATAPAQGGRGVSGMQLAEMLTAKSMTTTKDGGVLVLTGTKVLKYDKNLNLVKEARIDLGFDEVRRKIQEIEMERMREKKERGDKDWAVSAAKDPC